MNYKPSLWSDILYYCSQNELNLSFFLKQVHASSSLQIRSKFLIEGNALFYNSNNFNDQHVKCQPKISQWNISNMSECSIALEMAADSTIFLILHYSKWYKYPKELMERFLL